MLCDVTFRCGHTGMVNLTGQYEERQRKRLRYSNFVICPDCQMAAHGAQTMRPAARLWAEADRFRPHY